jgi:hypothetical protein
MDIVMAAATALLEKIGNTSRILLLFMVFLEYFLALGNI